MGRVQTIHTGGVLAYSSGNIVGCINEVTLCRARLVLRRVTNSVYTVLVFNRPNQANSAFHPSRVGKTSTGLLGCSESGARSTVSGGR